MNTISKLATAAAFAALAACGGSSDTNTTDANMTADMNAGMTDLNAMDMNAMDANMTMNADAGMNASDMNMGDTGGNMTGTNATDMTGNTTSTNGM
jgi:hypothetical protein